MPHLSTEIADSQVAGRFVDELERTTRQLERHPELGSLRFAFELDLPGVRSFRVESFPYVVVYLVRDDLVRRSWQRLPSGIGWRNDDDECVPA